jgi:S1-C subfamily serine protease
VDNTVDNTPATTYGIQAGDVILSLDGVPVRSQSELLRERDKHQQGDAFTLNILRAGAPKTINARFKACSAEEIKSAEEKTAQSIERQENWMLLQSLENLKGFEKSERPILGVYEDTEAQANGLVLESVIEGKGAAMAGLKPGDVVIKVDGKPVTGASSLRSILDAHKVGDQVSVVYTRAGKNMEVQTTLSSDNSSFHFKTERDPCKVFIGVYTSVHGLNGRGTRVDGVIDGTPAKVAGVQTGDIILALNGQAVNSYNELTLERDKNKPGDAFRLTIQREGATMEIKARFQSCDTPEKETPAVVEETPVVEQRETPKPLENTLKMEVFEAYPSPTFGPVNIRFEAEAVPTTVRILDLTGRVVYRKDLPKFDGAFSEQVNLSNNKAGNYVLSIEQGGKVQTKQIVLINKA